MHATTYIQKIGYKPLERYMHANCFVYKVEDNLGFKLVKLAHCKNTEAHIKRDYEILNFFFGIDTFVGMHAFHDGSEMNSNELMQIKKENRFEKFKFHKYKKNIFSPVALVKHYVEGFHWDPEKVNQNHYDMLKDTIRLIHAEGYAVRDIDKKNVKINHFDIPVILEFGSCRKADEFKSEENFEMAKKEDFAAIEKLSERL